MIVELRIRNFAVLGSAVLRLGPGLCVISGETGAGKSIIVDALELLLGGRASSSVVRSGHERAVLEGVVDVRGLADVAAALDELGLDADDDHLVMRREIRRGGRSRAWVGGSPVTAGVLRHLGALLVDIHGQHEHQRLMSADFQRRVLDAFGECDGLAARVAEHFRRAARLEKRLAALTERRRDLESRADFIRFRLGEIRSAKLRAGEDEELRVETARMDNADVLLRESVALGALLHDDDGSVADRLSDAAARLRRLADVDPALAAHAAALDDAYHTVTDAAAELRSYGDAIDHDPAQLERLHERQALLQALMRKYGPTLAVVIETGETLARELDELETAELDAGSLRKEVAHAQQSCATSASELSRRRRDAADRLARETEAAFPGLGLEGGRFRVDLEPLAEPAARGRERVRFMASMNPGFPPAPLSRIASGGELSRVMLALKSILAGIDELPTLVFDEIDAGIGGTVAARVGKRLREVARGRQVLAVTHLARIAARADSHFVVEKRTVDGAAKTALRRLGPDERVRELARMLGGDPGSEPSLEHARELLGRAGPPTRLPTPPRRT